MLICEGTAHLASVEPEWSEGYELLDDEPEVDEEAQANARALAALEKAMTGVTRRG